MRRCAEGEKSDTHQRDGKDDRREDGDGERERQRVQGVKTQTGNRQERHPQTQRRGPTREGISNPGPRPRFATNPGRTQRCATLWQLILARSAPHATGARRGMGLQINLLKLAPLGLARLGRPKSRQTTHTPHRPRLMVSPPLPPPSNQRQG